MNSISLSADETLDLPEPMDGRARDLLLRMVLVEQTGSVVPVPSFDTGATYETESGEWPDFSDAGTYIVRLTEIANDTFLLQSSTIGTAANPAA